MGTRREKGWAGSMLVICGTVVAGAERRQQLVVWSERLRHKKEAAPKGGFLFLSGSLDFD